MTFVAPNLACGEARGGRIPCHGAVTDEQRSHRPNSAQPGRRQVFFAQTLLLAPHRSTAGYARRSRLVWAKNPLPRTSSYLCLRPLRSRFFLFVLKARLSPEFMSEHGATLFALLVVSGFLFSCGMLYLDRVTHAKLTPFKQ